MTVYERRLKWAENSSGWHHPTNYHHCQISHYNLCQFGLFWKTIFHTFFHCFPRTLKKHFIILAVKKKFRNIDSRKITSLYFWNFSSFQNDITVGALSSLTHVLVFYGTRNSWGVGNLSRFRSTTEGKFLKSQHVVFQLKVF